MTEYIITTKSNSIAILSEQSFMLHLNSYNPYDETRKDQWEKVYTCEAGTLREIKVAEQIELLKKFKKEKKQVELCERILKKEKCLS